MNNYELTFIVDADVAEDKRETIVSSIKTLLSQNKAEPGELETWGKRDFTFPIDRKTAGVYYLQYFQADPAVIDALEQKLRINTSIMRYLLVKQVKKNTKKPNRAAARTKIADTYMR